jgi:hypothetical protein
MALYSVPSYKAEMCLSVESVLYERVKSPFNYMIKLFPGFFFLFLFLFLFFLFLFFLLLLFLLFFLFFFLFLLLLPSPYIIVFRYMQSCYPSDRFFLNGQLIDHVNGYVVGGF